MNTQKPWVRNCIQWGVIPLVIGLILAGMAAVVVEARGEPVRAGTSQRCVPPDPSMTCKEYSKQYAKKKVRQFEAGKLSTAAGFNLPRKWKRALTRWHRNHPNARPTTASGDDDWWKFPLESWACTPIAGMGYKVNCENGADHYKKFADESVKITVLCGGTAAIGALAGGGVAGAGKGALGCLWANLIYKVIF